MNNKFTKDPVLVLLTKVISHYEMCKQSSVSFDKYNEYDVVRGIISILQEINTPSKPKLKLLKGE